MAFKTLPPKDFKTSSAGLPHGSAAVPLSPAAAAAQQAQREFAHQAAKQVAHQGAAFARSTAEEVHRHIQASSYTVKGLAFTVSIVLLVSSGLCVANVFNVVFNPFQYLLAIYNASFALIIVLMEGDQDWFKSCRNLQVNLFDQAKFLTSRTGRAIFYFFVGSMNLFVLPQSWLWKVIYICIGLALCFVGTMSLLDRYGCLGAEKTTKGADAAGSSSSSGSDAE
eukprot:TRINITY_DN108897_c0_g1_i1.p1 TRINITY_DN108897_c0_g1~~TRINITY_DN108897_c0_g1_i1.p1  ORF type:complete len:249 (-),score=35.72 TRINITY_DN108897_c0_g1_i1:39-710(-)